MGIVRAATTATWAPPYLANAARTEVAKANLVTPAFLSPDRTIVYGWRGSDLVKSVDDAATWTTVRTFDGSIMGAWTLPNGEALVSIKWGGGKGYLARSTGWAAGDSAATWTSCFTVSRNDNYVHGSWGLSWAPADHARAGLVVATEYGGQGAASDTAAVMGKVWLSLDYGVTWRVVFNLSSVGTTSQHMHGITYDPWTDALLASIGDGNSGAGARSGILACWDWLNTSPTWAWVHGPFTTAEMQLTTMFPTATGVICGGDGYPCGLYRVPRRSARAYGRAHVVENWGSGTEAGFIGQTLYSVGNHFPIIVGREYTKSSPFHPSTLGIVTGDGAFVSELWRDPSGSGVAAYASATAIGPTATGKIVGAMHDHRNGADVYAQLVADLILP